MMNDTISRQAAIDCIVWWFGILQQNPDILIDSIKTLPSAEPESVEIGERLAKIADLVEGTIDHFDLDDAMDLLYQIKGVLK